MQSLEVITSDHNISNKQQKIIQENRVMKNINNY